MRFESILAAFAAALPLTNGLSQGFNVAANNADGSCKTTAQWAAAFKKLKGLPQHFPNVRVYASSDCNTLANAVPAAINTGTKLLVGVWTEDNTHYTNEKNALVAAIKNHGKNWILAISVGSEDLYRGDTSAQTLAGQINEVRGIVRKLGVTQPIGHVDTWTAWVDGRNTAVINAVDFLGMDGYPYFQKTAIGQAAPVFWDSVQATKNVAKGKPVWVTETGWPVSGKKMGNAVASLANARKYFHDVYCQYSKQISIFWYVYQDYNQSPSFGIFNKSGQRLYDTAGC